MLVAFKVILVEAIHRMHRLHASPRRPGRHTRAHAPGTVLVRVRVARWRPQRIPVHCGPVQPLRTAWPGRLAREVGHSHRPDKH